MCHSRMEVKGHGQGDFGNNQANGGQIMPKKEAGNDIKDKIAEVCKEVVLQEEIIKLQQQLQQKLAEARQQLVFWDTKIKQLSGALANCNAILEKSQKAKVLELEGDNTKPKKK